MQSIALMQHVFRYRTTEVFLKAGVDILKIDEFRPIFHRAGHSGTFATHHRYYIPKIEASVAN